MYCICVVKHASYRKFSVVHYNLYTACLLDIKSAFKRFGERQFNTLSALYNVVKSTGSKFVKSFLLHKPCRRQFKIRF